VVDGRTLMPQFPLFLDPEASVRETNTHHVKFLVVQKRILTQDTLEQTSTYKECFTKLRERKHTDTKTLLRMQADALEALSSKQCLGQLNIVRLNLRASASLVMEFFF
jgi:hypothetical protein